MVREKKLPMEKEWAYSPWCIPIHLLVFLLIVPIVAIVAWIAECLIFITDKVWFWWLDEENQENSGTIEERN